MACGIERMQRAGPAPGGGERRACGVVAGNDLENMVRVGGALDSPHPILPAAPPAASALGGDQRPLYRIRYMLSTPRLATGNRTRRRFRFMFEALRAFFPRGRRRPPVGVEQGGA